MSMTNPVDANYGSAYYVQANNTAVKPNSEEDNVSIYADKGSKAEKIDVDYACTDGKDDGKLGFGETMESVGKGILKSAKNMVTAPFTEAAKGNFLPLAAVAGGALLCATPLGAPIAVIGGVLGLAKGAVDVVGGISKASEIANSADGTDGEAKAALEQIGSGVLTTGLSATAVFGGLKTMKGRAGSEMNKLASKAKAGEKVGFGEKVRAFGSDTVSSGKQTFGKLTGKSAAAAGAEANTAPDAEAAPDTPETVTDVDNAAQGQQQAG